MVILFHHDVSCENLEIISGEGGFNVHCTYSQIYHRVIEMRGYILGDDVAVLTVLK